MSWHIAHQVRSKKRALEVIEASRQTYPHFPQAAAEVLVRQIDALPQLGDDQLIRFSSCGHIYQAVGQPGMASIKTEVEIVNITP